MDWVQRRRVRIIMVAVAAIVISPVLKGGMSTVQAQTGSSQSAPGNVSLNVADTDLAQVAILLTRDTNQSIVIDPDIRQKKVNAFINDKPLEVVLRSVVEIAGCSLTKSNDIYFIKKADAQATSVQASGSNDATTAMIDSSLSARGRSSNQDYVDPQRDTKVESIKLYNTNPVDIMWAIGLYSFENAPVINQGPVKPGVKINNTPGPYQQLEDGTLKLMNDFTTPMTESLKNKNTNEANRTAPISAEANQYFPGGTAPTSPSRPSTPAGAGTNVNAGGLLPSTIQFVMPYILDNSLLVRGDEDGINELKNIINMLDVAPKQISIKAEFVSISTGDLSSLGINWALDRMGTSFSTQFAPAGNVALGIASGNIIANLKAQSQTSGGKLINAPLVTTINNVPAQIMFMTQVPYQNTYTVYAGGNSVPTTSTSVETIDVTSQLWVLPRVNNADNSITVQISPQISDIERFVPTGTSGQTLPIINTQQISTIRRVANGETIVLGGLIRRDNKQTVDEIPLLGRLPIIGPIFRSVSNSTDDKELLILLTPTIVSEKPIAGSGIGVNP